MEFYKLYRSSDSGTKGSRGWYASEPDGSKMIFPAKLRTIFRGEIKLSEPISLKIKGGRETDFVSGGFKFIFNQKVLECLLSSNFTGWDTFPVRLLDKNDKELPDFHGFVITGRCGPVLNECKSGEGIVIDPKSWDGSDFFMPGPHDFQFCTERVIETFARQKFKGIQWKKLSEVWTFNN